MIATKFKTVNEYIATFPKNTQDIIKEIRKTVKEAAPNAVEVISYNMSAIKFHGILVYYAAYKNHLGIYPTANGIEAFKEELSSYKWSKAAIQFPIAEPMPLALITKIVKFRNNEVVKSKKINFPLDNLIFTITFTAQREL